jgi:hypothetical protein
MATCLHRFQLESPAFGDGEPLPALYTAEGLDLSPPLHWRGEPAQTASFTLWMEDPDAPSGTWIHWVLFNIPGHIHALPAGLERLPELPNGARHGRCGGVVHFPRLGYQGPEPPPGPSHHYCFQLFALARTLPLEAGATPMAVRRAMRGHVLDRSRLVGTYATA